MRHLTPFVLLLTSLVGCSNGGANSDKTKTFTGKTPIKVVATTGMIGDLVRNVGGSHVAVTDLFKPGVDPHTYRPNVEDLRTLQSANYVFYNGLHLEGKMGTILGGLTTPNAAIGDVLLTLPTPPDRPIYKDGWTLKDDEHSDPHVWFDVYLWMQMSNVVAKKLSEFDPLHAADYAKNDEAYRKRLFALDEEVRKQLRSIPKDQRYLVTSHDAFRYFGRAYDVKVESIQGVSTDAEAGLAKVSELVEFLTKSKVKAVFVESSVNPRSMQAVIDGCKARGHEVKKGGELFSDAMGDTGTPEGTYEGMIRHNVKTIVEALK